MVVQAPCREDMLTRRYLTGQRGRCKVIPLPTGRPPRRSGTSRAREFTGGLVVLMIAWIIWLVESSRSGEAATTSSSWLQALAVFVTACGAMWVMDAVVRPVTWHQLLFWLRRLHLPRDL